MSSTTPYRVEIVNSDSKFLAFINSALAITIVAFMLNSCENNNKQLEQRQREQKAAIIKLIDSRFVRTEDLLLNYTNIDINKGKSLYIERYNEYFVNSVYKWNEDIESLYQSIMDSNHSQSPEQEIQEINNIFEELEKELVHIRYKSKKPPSGNSRLCIEKKLKDLSDKRELLIKKFFPKKNTVLNKIANEDYLTKDFEKVKNCK
ncbi:MAG: hypothetical protein QNJ47_04100 [Nostocaceae cyanobacterium]|nr:hypothetical protein [Nostocaceae cyanobacterium]